MRTLLWLLLLQVLAPESAPALQRDSCEQVLIDHPGFKKYRDAHKFGIDEAVPGAFRISASTIRNYQIPALSKDIAFPLTQFSIGVEFPRRDEPGKSGRKFDFSFRDVSLRQAFDKIVEETPEYAWRVSGGVVNIYPRGAKTGLDVRVPEFVVNSTDVYSAGGLLAAEAQRLGITLSVPNELMRDLLSHAPRITIQLSNATIRECLNAIVATDPGTRWWAHIEANHISVRISPSPILMETALFQQCKAAGVKYRERHIREGFTLKDGLWVKPGPKSRKKSPTDTKDLEAK